MPRKFEAAVTGWVAARGYSIIPGWRLPAYPQSTYMRQLFAHLSIDCVLDVGANLGQYRDFLRREVGYEGMVVSFEPIHANAVAIRNRAKSDPRWRIEECALGATPGSATLNVMQSSEFSSFLRPDQSVSKRFENANKVVAQVEVEVRTLADVLPRIERECAVSAFYLKLDTQGFDLEVARGAGAAIERFRALQTEVAFKPLYEGAPDHAISIPAFRALGFEPSAIFPNNPDHFPLMYEFDCHMIARPYAKDDANPRATIDHA